MSKIKDVAKKSKVITKLYNSFIRNSKKDAIEEVVHDYYKELAGKKIILVGHSGGLGGAEVLLRNMIQEFVRQKYQVVVLVRGNGPIIESYQKYAPTFVIDTVEKNVDYIQRLKRLGYNSAILNTITNGDLIPLCKQNDIHVVQLIHELPGVIHALKCEERAEIIATQADLVVFPANFVKEKFETIAPLKVPFKVKPQGLYMVYNNWNKSESRNYLKQQYNIPLDHFIVLNVGLGERRKGFDLFVEKCLMGETNFILSGSMEHRTKLSTSPVGSIIRLENLVKNMHENIDFYQSRLDQKNKHKKNAQQE